VSTARFSTLSGSFRFLLSLGLLVTLTPVKAQSSTDDCSDFDAGLVIAQASAEGWSVSGISDSTLQFAREDHAHRAVEIIQHYGFNRICGVGDTQTGLQYFLTDEQVPTGPPAEGEDCIPFSAEHIELVYTHDAWRIVDGRMWLMAFGDASEDATQALKIMRQHRFDQQCFVGRPNAPMSYMKRSAVAAGGNPPP
jgi:hypothetical protein